MNANGRFTIRPCKEALATRDVIPGATVRRLSRRSVPGSPRVLLFPAFATMIKVPTQRRRDIGMANPNRDRVRLSIGSFVFDAPTTSAIAISCWQLD